MKKSNYLPLVKKQFSKSTSTYLTTCHVFLFSLVLDLPASFIWFLSFCPFLHREAESFKEQGNAFYVKKDYAEAFNYYTKAIGNSF